MMVMRRKILIMRTMNMIMNNNNKKMSLVLNEPKHKSGKGCKYQLSGRYIVEKQQEVTYKKEENQSRDFPTCIYGINIRKFYDGVLCGVLEDAEINHVASNNENVKISTRRDLISLSYLYYGIPCSS